MLIILEVSLGGGGRLFDTGLVSPRMVLFGLGLAYTAVALLLREKTPREFVFLTGVFVALSGVSAFISTLENQPVLAALKDFKPLAYFLLLPFFAITVRSVNDVLLVGRLLKFSALSLAILYLIVMAIWKFGFLTTVQMYDWLNPAHTAEAEFLFRGGTTFFFKAELYVGVGVFFFIVEKNRNWSGAVLMLLLTIALTMTRGMWLAVFMVLAAWAFFYTGGPDDRLKGTALAAGFLLAGVMGAVSINEALPSAAQSNAIRMNDLKAMVDASKAMADAPKAMAGAPKAMAGVITVLFGRGFGADVFGRQIIEMSYPMCFIKQGIAGIIFWFLPAVYLAWRMRVIRDAERRSLAMPYFMAAAFVYVVSFTNPFLTNPIGMSVVMIAMVAVGSLDARTASSDQSRDFPSWGSERLARFFDRRAA